GEDAIPADREVRRDVPAKGGKTARVLADECAVDVQVGDQAGAVELEEQLPAGLVVRDRVMPAVPADAAGIVVAAVLPVQVIPGVGHVHGPPRGVGERAGLCPGTVATAEPPGGVEAGDAPGIGPTGTGRTRGAAR